MVKCFNFLIFVWCFKQAQLNQKTLFQNADHLMESVLGDIYKVHDKSPSLNITIPKRDQYRRLRKFQPDVNRYQSMKNKNISVDSKLNDTYDTNKLNASDLKNKRTQLKLMHLRNDIERILNTPTILPNFNPKQNEFDTITRDYEALKKKTRRQHDFMHYEGDWRAEVTHKAHGVMANFIYLTRQTKLPFVQERRQEYVTNYKFQIGWCFALLYHLKRQQKYIYNSLHIFGFVADDLLFHMSLYEKILRLDVDIKDLLRYIRKLNYMKHMRDDPHYYDYSLEHAMPHLPEGYIPEYHAPEAGHSSLPPPKIPEEYYESDNTD